MDDRNSQQKNFVFQKAGLSLGMNLEVARDQQVSLGFGTDFVFKRFDASGLTTGSQFVENRGFDPRIANGELVDQLNNNYIGLSMGFVWTRTDGQKEPLTRFGLAWRDFNRPNDSFFEETTTPLPSTLQVSLSHRIYENNNFSLVPNALFTQFNGDNTLQLGSAMIYNLSKDGNNLNLFGGILIDKGLYGGIQYVETAYEIGFSYDFPVGNRAIAFERTLEFSLILKKPVTFRERAPRVKSRKKKVPKSNRNTLPRGRSVARKMPARTNSGTTETVESMDSMAVKEMQEDEEPTSVGSVEVGEITPEGIELETISQNIEFDFNSTHITDSTHLYLYPLAEMLSAYPEVRISIVGHTDNVGHRSYNKKLSLKRARVIRDYLLDRGVNTRQIEVIGMGDSQPIDTNETEEGRSRNRRVEVIIQD
jgi:outer membrane protein OmpA-like peptidoglycan-associated protein